MKTILNSLSDYEGLCNHYQNVKDKAGIEAIYDLRICVPHMYPCIAVTAIIDNARGRDYITCEYVYNYDIKGLIGF